MSGGVDYKSSKFSICRGHGYCALPIGGDTYRNCVNGCLYCYERQADNQHIRDKTLHALDFRSLFNSIYDDPAVRLYIIDSNVAVRLGIKSDPFPPIEKEQRFTLRLLRLLADAGIQVQLTTKRPNDIDDEHIAVMRDCKRAMVRVSFSTFDDGKAARLEPGAPSPSDRLRDMRRLADAGIEVGCRLAPWLHTESYDYQVIADSGANNVTLEPFRFSCLWRGHVSPVMWEVFSGETAPEGDIKDKKGALRKWAEKKEKEFFAPLQNLDVHTYYSGGNHWIYYDIHRLRAAYLAEQEKARSAGLKFGLCTFGGGVHSIDLNDAPCGCLTDGWGHDDAALVPLWHKNRWDDLIVPLVYDSWYDVLMERFWYANSEEYRPVALDGEIERVAFSELPKFDKQYRGKRR